MIHIENSYTEPSYSNQRVQFDDFVGHLVNITPITTRGNKVRCACPVHGGDNPTALQIWQRKDGSVGAKCWSHGCSYQSIIDRVIDDPTRHDYEPKYALKNGKRDESWTPYWERQIEAIYDYRDENGVLLYQKIRFSKQAYPDDPYAVRRPHTDPNKAANGYWHWKLGNTDRVLYNLPDVISAHTVLFCEGEKDADRANTELESLGLYGEIVATTTHDGAGGRWLESYNDALFLKEVVVIPDNDTAGHKHAHVVSQKLRYVAYSVKVIQLTEFVSDLSVGGDVSDFLDSGHPIEAIIVLATITESLCSQRIERTTTTNTENRPTNYINRKAETCECAYCQCRNGAAVTFYNDTVFVRPMGNAPLHMCKGRQHHEAIRWVRQIEEEQTTRESQEFEPIGRKNIFEQTSDKNIKEKTTYMLIEQRQERKKKHIDRHKLSDRNARRSRWKYQHRVTVKHNLYSRKLCTESHNRWTARNRQNKKRGNEFHRGRPIKMNDGSVYLISTDKTDGELLPRNVNDLYDIIYPLLSKVNPNTRNRPCGDDDNNRWGGNYEGSKGNGKRKRDIRKYGDEAAGKCAVYLSSLSPMNIANRLGIKKGSKQRFKIKGAPHETYERMIHIGIDLRLPHSNKGAIDLWAVAGSFDEPNYSTVMDKGDGQISKDHISLNRDNSQIENMSDDEIDRLIPIQRRFPDESL